MRLKENKSRNRGSLSLSLSSRRVPLRLHSRALLKRERTQESNPGANVGRASEGFVSERWWKRVLKPLLKPELVQELGEVLFQDSFWKCAFL